MRIFKLCKQIPALLIFLLCACKPVPTPIESESISFVEEEISQSSSEEKEASPLWDMDTVDISEIDRKRKLIAFTFDDAPSKTLENILAVFAAFNEENPDCLASATIFFNGKLFNEQTTHLAYAAHALGFELGNHSHSHYDMTKLSEKELITEWQSTDILLEKIDGKKRHLLRAPFGNTNELIKSTATAPLIDWTIDTLDWTGVSEEAIYKCVFDNKFSGAIVLMHDGYEYTVSALKRLLPDLKASGYQVVSVSKMAKAHACSLYNGKVYIRARKQN